MYQMVLRSIRLAVGNLPLILLMLCSQLTVMAQSPGATTASVTGSVVDELGTVISNATVQVKNIETNFTRETVTGNDGGFIISQLPPGSYELTSTFNGFIPKKIRFELVLGTTALINASMRLAAGDDYVVEVQAGGNSPEFELVRTESSTNINEQSIDNLPINRRNFLDFTLTAARVVADGNGQGAAASSGLSFNGQSSRFNNITIDGLDNNDSGSGSVRATLSQDAVQEFQIITDGFSAEFGRSLGGVVNIVTKSGGNQYHGSLFGFNRNDTISARAAFSPINPDYRQYQFGATLSGPIKKDKAFFFSSFERLTIKQNNVVTISDQSVAAARRVGLPLANGPIPFSIGTTTLLARADLQISPDDLLFVRYNGGFAFNGGFEEFGGLTASTNSGLQELDDNTLVVNNTYISKRFNLVNETRFLFTNRVQDVTPLDPGPQVRLLAPEGNIIFGRSSFLPQPRDQRFYQFVDNVTLTRSRQQIKFGFDIFITQPPEGKSALPVVPGGVAIFTPFNFASLLNVPGLPSFTGLEAFDPSLRSQPQRDFLNLLAALLPTRVKGFPSLPLADLSLPTAYLQGFGDPNEVIPAQFYSFFIQDDIKLRHNLLIKAGLRYDFNRARFVPNNRGNFSPRLALSYRPERFENLNIHSSYGVFYNIPITGIAVAVELADSGRIKLPVVPFPFSIIPFAQPGHHFPDSTTIPAGINFIPQLSQTFQYQRDLRNSYTQQVNFGFDYLLNNNTVVSVNYDYVRGIKLFNARNINPVVRPVASALQSAMEGRIDPTRGDVVQFESSFDSYYHALTISLSRRFSNHFSLLTHYTLSKAIDNSNDFGALSRENNDPLNIGGERGLSLLDVRSRFVLSGLWDLSYTKNQLLTGFQLSTIVTLNTGRPYNLLAGVDLNRNGDNPPGDRPAGLGRNVGIKPGFANLDLRLTRTFTVKEHYRFEGFVEAFNLFNRVNINEIDRIFLPDGQGNFQLPPKDGSRYLVTPDRFRGAFAPRQFQFGFRVAF